MRVFICSLMRCLSSPWRDISHGMSSGVTTFLRLALRVGAEVLVHAVVVHDGDVARLPVVADAVVDLVALAVEDVEGGLVDVPVLLRRAARTILLEMDMEHLADAVLRLDVVAAVGLRAAHETDVGRPPPPRDGAPG